MAILKMVNYKSSGECDMEKAIDYCFNRDKMKGTEHYQMGIADDIKESAKVNKWLNGKSKCKRHFKSCIISLETVWSPDKKVNLNHVNKMKELLDVTVNYWGKQGYQTFGVIHCNTKHPHIHLIIDSCNVLSGKQLSQSPEFLRMFKEFMNEQLGAIGLNEVIVSKEISINVEDMEKEDDDNWDVIWEEDTSEFVGDVFEEDTKNTIEKTVYTNLLNQPDDYTTETKKIMCLVEMCKIVDNTMRASSRTNTHLRNYHNSCNGNSDEHKGREMCRIVKKAPGTMEHWNRLF